MGSSDSGAGFRLANILGVEIRVDWSLTLIFLLLLFNLAGGLIPSWHPDWGPLLIWATAAVAALLFIASILAHELAHAVVARRNGIPVSRITLFLFGGLAHMEGEPPTARSELLMAIVGPLTSIAIGITALVAGAALAGPDLAARLAGDPETAMATVGPVASLLLWLGPVNIALGLFNLVPGFPLDGGRVFRAVVWWLTGDLRKATRWASIAGRAVAWGLMAWGVVDLLGGRAIQGLWILMIGWFLHNAARMSYQQLVIREGLRDVPVSRIMRTRLASVAPDTTVERLVHDELMASDQRAFPVLSADDALLGLVCLDDVRKAPRTAWAERTVAEIMTPVESLAVVAPDAPAERALATLEAKKVDQLPVIAGDRLVGLVRRQDVLTWLSLHVDDAARPAREVAE